MCKKSPLDSYLESHPKYKGKFKFVYGEALNVLTSFHCTVDEINNVVHLTVSLADLRMFYSMLLALWSQNPDNPTIVNYLDFLKPLVKND